MYILSQQKEKKRETEDRLRSSLQLGISERQSWENGEAIIENGWEFSKTKEGYKFPYKIKTMIQVGFWKKHTAL